MTDWIAKIEQLDVCVFEKIFSQTEDTDRRSLLAIQRAIARKLGSYCYLEIGSYWGGSIQPHLIDDRCKKIFSVDARLSAQNDDREPGYISYYENNTSKNMLELLHKIGYGDIQKITCLDCNVSQLNDCEIVPRPDIVFIDSEHTHSGVLSDFRFCDTLVRSGGTVIFHDFNIVPYAILEICEMLKKQQRIHVAVKLEGSVFAIFFDPDYVRLDAYLSALYEKNKNFIQRWRKWDWWRKRMPASFSNFLYSFIVE